MSPTDLAHGRNHFGLGQRILIRVFFVEFLHGFVEGNWFFDVGAAVARIGPHYLWDQQEGDGNYCEQISHRSSSNARLAQDYPSG
jgi:hypothetical protein